VEEIFGWMKTIGGLRKVKFRGKDLVGWMFNLRGGSLQPGSHAKPGRPSCVNNRTEGLRRVRKTLQ